VLRRLSALLVAATLVLVPAGVALAAAPPSKITSINFPILSEHGNMDFWKIPWQPGDKLEGSFEVKVNAPVRGLTVRPLTGAVSIDPASRRVIPRDHIQFSAPDGSMPLGAQADGPDQGVLAPGGYLFTFWADNIPGEDTYLVEIEAAGEVQDPATGQLTPFTEQLPNIKLKAFAEPEVRMITGSTLTAQWINVNAPWGLLKPLELLLDRSREAFSNRYSPPLVVAMTMPGRPHVETTQHYDIDVALDPLLDEDGNESDQVDVSLAIVAQDAEAGAAKDPETGLRHRTLPVGGNKTLMISVSRSASAPAPDGTVSTQRIAPGVYKSQLHIKTEWGTKYDLPVEIRVKDSPFFAVLALITGILVSLLGAYWQTRQPLYRAQVKARRWQRYYDEQGILLALVDRVSQRLNGCIVAGDGAGATQSADLLESLLRELPGTLALDAALTELQGLAPASAFEFWSLTLNAPNIASAFERLKGFCASHHDPNVQKFGGSIETSVWHATPRSVPAAQPEMPLRERFGLWLRAAGAAVQTWFSRLRLPSLLDMTTMVVMFVLVNGALIALQMSQSYSHNETFGAGTDYMSLLLWGFAGDATRATLTDLAGKVVPRGGGSAAGGGAPPNQ